MNPRIVVTGAAGFIGSQILRALRWNHHPTELLLVDQPLTMAKMANIAGLDDVRFVNHLHFIDLLERGEIKPELIIHMGACSDTTEINWEYLRENNFSYSMRLWMWCANSGSRLIYASSAATYGDGSQGFDDEAPLGRMAPLNLYAKSKHDFDLFVEHCGKTRSPKPRQCVGLKFFNVFGPGETNKGRMASMAYHAWAQLKTTGSVKLFEPGTQKRDFVYIDDVVRWVLSIADRQDVSGLFNMGTGKAESFNRLAEAVAIASGIDGFIEYIPMPKDLIGKYQDFTEAKMDKLRSFGIATDPTPLDESCRRYAEWLEQNLPSP